MRRAGSFRAAARWTLKAPMSFDPPTRISSPTGATLRLFRREAEGALRGVVQVNHGLAEHALRYERFADFLAGEGFATYAHDHRGHGGTRAPDAPRGSFGRNGAAQVLADVAAVHERIADEQPGAPVIVFGHSMGGLIALNFAMRFPRKAAGVAIWNANFVAGPANLAARAVLAWERFRLGSDVPSRLLPRLTFQAWGAAVPGAQTAFDWLSRDEAEVAKYMRDPLCGWDASVGMWRDVFELARRGADDRGLAGVPRGMPFHLVGGGADPATEGGEAVTRLATRLRRNGFSNLRTTIYAETRHESLNELNRDIIMRDFAAWAREAVEGKIASGVKGL